MLMKVTATHIARTLGLSQPTVSQILNGKGSLYRPETCQRVLETAARLGYRPNTFARGIRSGRFGTLGLVMSTQSNRALLNQDIQLGIQREIAEHGLLLVSSLVSESSLEEDAAPPRILAEDSTDGLLLGYAHGDLPPMLARLEASGRLPVVWINRKDRRCCVHPDDRGGGANAVAHLVALGHRRIAYLGFGHSGHYSFADRREGYRDGMRAAGLATEEPEGPAEAIAWVQRMREILRRPDRPTALVCGAGEAGPAIIAALLEGLRIPDDVSVVGVGETLSDYAGIRQSAARVRFIQLGIQAVRTLLERIADPAAECPSVALPVEVEARGSCGPAPHCR